MRQIDPFDLVLRTCEDWENGWFLLTAGDFASGNYNTMTVAWGGMGVLWSKPVVQVVVRPTRHTFGFMNDYDTFTLTAFPKQYKKALGILGSKSGRDGDKIAESGLTAVASQVVAAPTFAEAKLSIEGKKIYWQDMEPANFLDPVIHQAYADNDYHRFYVGEIMHIAGSEEYC
jgi:flavin reductase (DIM6/NTAB) family NADH-FMN oxidoreductase RutF